MKELVVVALVVVEAEFPDFEVVQAFSAFDVRHSDSYLAGSRLSGLRPDQSGLRPDPDQRSAEPRLTDFQREFLHHIALMTAVSPVLLRQ